MWIELFTLRELGCAFVSAVTKLLVRTLRERWRVTYWYSGGSATTSAIVLAGRAGRADSNGDLDFGPPLAAAAGLTTTTMVSDGSRSTSWFFRQALAELLTRGEPHTNTRLYSSAVKPVLTADETSHGDPSSTWWDGREWSSITRRVSSDASESTSLVRQDLSDGRESTSITRPVLSDGCESTSKTRQVLSDGREST